jgi:hypothetical protein
VKIARTFTLDLALVSKLKEQRNQSKFVESAIRAKLMAMDLIQPTIITAKFKCTVCLRTKFSRADDTFVFCNHCGMDGDGGMIKIDQ